MGGRNLATLENIKLILRSLLTSLQIQMASIRMANKMTSPGLWSKLVRGEEFWGNLSRSELHALDSMVVLARIRSCTAVFRVGRVIILSRLMKVTMLTRLSMCLSNYIFSSPLQK